MFLWTFNPFFWESLTLKKNNTLKKIQKKHLSRTHGKPSILQHSRELPEWAVYIRPPHNTTERTAITHCLKNPFETIKSLLDKPYYYEDSGVKLEVKFNNGAGTSIRHQSIQREDMIEKAVTSICNSYMKSCFNPDISSHNCSCEFEWKRDLSNIPQ